MNILDNAKFGDKFVTKDNKLLLFCSYIEHEKNRVALCLLEGCVQTEVYSLDGHRLTSVSDVSDIYCAYRDSLDEESLRDKAYEWTSFVNSDSLVIKTIALECAMAGYRKAKEDFF